MEMAKLPLHVLKLALVIYFPGLSIAYPMHFEVKPSPLCHQERHLGGSGLSAPKDRSQCITFAQDSRVDLLVRAGPVRDEFESHEEWYKRSLASREVDLAAFGECVEVLLAFVTARASVLFTLADVAKEIVARAELFARPVLEGLVATIVGVGMFNTHFGMRLSGCGLALRRKVDGRRTNLCREASRVASTKALFHSVKLGQRSLSSLN